MKKLFIMGSSSILFYSVVTFIGCNSGQHDLDLGKGRIIYRQKCSSCHNYQKSNTDYYPSLHEMIQMDTGVLEKKLNIYLADSLHRAVIGISDEGDMANLKYFLKNYDGIDY